MFNFYIRTTSMYSNSRYLNYIDINYPYICHVACAIKLDNFTNESSIVFISFWNISMKLMIALFVDCSYETILVSN